MFDPVKAQARNWPGFRSGPMSARGQSRRFGVGRESAYPPIPDILGALFIRRAVPTTDTVAPSYRPLR